MSRIGNNPISIPEGVSIDIQPDRINVKGKLGELTQTYDVVTLYYYNIIICHCYNNDHCINTHHI